MPSYQGQAFGPNTTLSWEGMSSNVKLGNDVQASRIRLLVPYLELHNDQARLLVSGFELELEIRHSSDAIPLLDGELLINRFELDPLSGLHDRIHLNGIHINLDTESTQNLFDSRLTLEAETLRLGQVEMIKGKLDIGFVNFDKIVLKILYTAWSQSHQLQLPQRQLYLTSLMFKQLPDLLKPKPEINLHLVNLNSALGGIDGSGRIAVDFNNPDVISNPVTLRKAISASVSLFVAEKLMVAIEADNVNAEFKARGNQQQTAQTVERIATHRVRERMFASQMGVWFVLNEGIYTFNFLLHDGQATINGKDVDWLNR